MFIVTKVEDFLMKLYESSLPNRLLTNFWYSYVGSLDKGGEVRFLNYGYENNSEEKILLKAEDETDRYSLQLYHHALSRCQPSGKNILEIGCGRGGGASYIARYFAPRTVMAGDISKTAIEFNRLNYQGIKNLNFTVADSQALPFGDESFDIVMNIESSHHYGNFDKFLSEVKRVLRPGGHLLLADYRKRIDEAIELKKNLICSGMVIMSEEDITRNVVKALDLDNERRKNLVFKLAPRVFWKIAMDFAGVKGSDLYNSLASGHWVYFNVVLQKTF